MYQNDVAFQLHLLVAMAPQFSFFSGQVDLINTFPTEIGVKANYYTDIVFLPSV